MKTTFQVTGLDVFARVKTDIEIAASATMLEISEGLKADLRQQVQTAGLGVRLSNTWRGKRYPEGGRVSLNAAAYVWSKAPNIVDAFDRAPTIVPVNGSKYLAIPTDNVPRRQRGFTPGSLVRSGSGTKMTPVEVEAYFNQDLHFARAGDKLIAYVNVVGAKNKKGFRRGTPKRLAQGRSAASVVMFIFVRAVKVPKKLDLDKPANYWAAQVQPILTRNLSA